MVACAAGGDHAAEVAVAPLCPARAQGVGEMEGSVVDLGRGEMGGEWEAGAGAAGDSCSGEKARGG